MPVKGSARYVLIALLILSIVLIGAIVMPFAPAIFIACVLAGALWRFTSRLAAKLRGRRQLAAGLVTLLVLLALVLPLGGITAWLVKMSVDAIAWVREVLEDEGIRGIVERLPGPIQGIGERVAATLPQDGQGVEQLPTNGGGAAVAVAGGVLARTTNVVVQTVIMLVALFFLLLDGDRLVDFLNRSLPFRRVHLREFLAEFRKASITVLVSSVATAAIQAAAALVGMLLARVPNAFFFGLVAFVLGLIPVIGAASVPVVLGVMLMLTGHLLAGGFLVGWGLLVVGLVDNVVKPYLIKEGVELHGAVVFFSLIGGIAVFGPIGLLAGPLIVVFFVSALRIVEKEFAEG